MTTRGGGATPDVPAVFLWGASTSPHQVEGNNTTSDWWARENGEHAYGERSGDAMDSYHRYREDMQLLADAGLNAYRFGIEWARLEPVEGHFSLAERDHYARMIATAHELGLTPVVTLHHFTVPAWFAAAGGWLNPDAQILFTRYVEFVTPILQDVEWVCTINEPNMLSMMTKLAKIMQEGGATGAITAQNLPLPDPEIGRILAEVHRAAVEVIRRDTSAKVGWTIALQAFTPTAGNEEVFRDVSYLWEDLYLEAGRADDFIGVQAYSSQEVGPDGPIPHPDSPDNTLVNTAYRPDALGIALRHAWAVGQGTPLLVTENGIATADDERRIAYTTTALEHLAGAMSDGVHVLGYLHWSALDNFEWGHFEPTFGLIAVDRTTFRRSPKPSLAWLGGVARNGVDSLGRGADAESAR
jgi:beta-glucosidase